MQDVSQESALQLRNLVKRLFEAAYSSDLNTFESIAIEFCHKSSNISKDTIDNICTNGISSTNVLSRHDLIGAVRDNNDASLLHISCAGCNMTVIRWLMDKCPNLITAVDKQGQTPLFYAIQNQNPLQLDLISLLLDHSDINIRDFDRNSLLHIAIKYDVINTVKYLITNGCEINSLSDTYGTPINMAVTTGNIDIVRLLVDSGADLHINSGKNTVPPLIFSSAIGNIELVKYLIEKGCNVNELDSNGWSSLHSSAEYGHFDVVKLLIKSGADVNYINNNATAYHLSLGSGNQELIQYLKDLTDPKYVNLEYHKLSVSEAINLCGNTRLECKELISAKQWIKAKLVYIQTIESIKHLSDNEVIKHELAILYSNLSIVHSSLNEFEESLNSGLKSIEYNPKWIKGHYRTAIAYKALNDNANYLCHLYEAAKLEGQGGPLWNEFSKNAQMIRNNTK